MKTAVRLAKVLLALLAFCASGAEPRTLVLVARNDSPVTTIDSIELRKLYLGIAVWRNGRALQPLRNRSDPRAEQIFLQTIVAMSETNYERRVLQMALKFGRPTPREFTNLEELHAVLKADSYALTYLWSDEVQPGQRAIRIIWRE